MPGYVLGINDGHNATACLLRDGSIKACASEERFTRTKNQQGFPLKASLWCMENAGITEGQLEMIVLSTRYTVLEPASNYSRAFRGIYKALYVADSILSRFGDVSAWAYASLIPVLSEKTRRRRIDRIARGLGVDHKKIVTIDHHLAHSYAGAFSSGFEDALVLTNDGFGDGACATVAIKSGNRIDVMSRTYYSNSLGLLYFTVTEYLGFKGLEDEHKIMGLAPYAKDPRRSPIYKNFSRQFDVRDNLTLRSKTPARNFGTLVSKRFANVRFDDIAAIIQAVTEETLMRWVRKSISRFRIGDVVLSGGTFMNVKANMLIGEEQGIKKLYVMPSAGDESNAIGAAYWGYLSLNQEGKIVPLTHVYLGPSYDDASIRSSLESGDDGSYSWKKVPRMNEAVAELLTTGKTVARFDGRMEFGARALGNRSILGRPDDLSMVRLLNQQVKGRDFWMPFAPTILSELAPEYLRSPQTNRVNADHMMIAFRGTERAAMNLIAASHFYDKTVRAQVLRPEWNPGYAAILDSFYSRTGIGGVLNTSFNLHGEPIVESPRDALSVFKRSGLDYLAIGDYLVSRPSQDN